LPWKKWGNWGRINPTGFGEGTIRLFVNSFVLMDTMGLTRGFALVKGSKISNSEQIPLKIPRKIFVDHV
jgi:hypothetical protein